MGKLFRALVAKSLPYLAVLLSSSPAFGNTLTVMNTNDSGPGQGVQEEGSRSRRRR